MKIRKDNVAIIEYTLKDKDGNVLDTSDGEEPLAYLQGHGNMLPKFEEQLEGKSKGDTIQFVLSKEDGYGERDEELVMEVPNSQFEESDKIEIGMQFQSDTKQGPKVLYVTAVKGDKVTVDGNNPMAGIELHFEVTVSEVRAATEVELQHGHGHVHGPGGHHH
jgi:FKBP-type peptidyl-prolyl cis-trans isomerase SlyD